MKKIIITLLFCVLASAAFAEGEINLPMMLGVDYNFGQGSWYGSTTNRTPGLFESLYFGSENIHNGWYVNKTRHDFGIFFDMYFARLDLKYWFEVSSGTTYTYSNGVAYLPRNSSSSITSYYPAVGYCVNGMDISLLFKLPIRTSESYKIYKSNIWFGAGLEYSVNITYDADQDGRNDFAYGDKLEKDGRDLNDLYGLLAFGATVDLNEKLALVPMFVFGYNFTPFMVTDDYIRYYVEKGDFTSLEECKNNNKVNMYKIEFGIGVAYKF